MIGRLGSSLTVVSLVAMIGACGGRWQGEGVHLVDGTWIGPESACDVTDLECRTVVELAHGLVGATLADDPVRIVAVGLPETFTTTLGETRRAQLQAGIMARRAVVVDLADGLRRVIGLWCHLPRMSDGAFDAMAADCAVAPLEDWRDGAVPPTRGDTG
jgi:hypothetical protein